ncbi:RNA-binding protein 42-like [Haliotis rubra]|uniref:RNA-binding protein 42-like n=1 Tax=Haliotis rubra TaxID=36100 RepID=UPI001EE59D8C|nr:RNA-binding protein 42-like [Haliotis rubra]
MASLTTEKLKEMEAEMNRFELEILTPGMPPKGGRPRMIIGSNTFNKVQAQLSGSGPGEGDPSIPLAMLQAPPPPPPTGNSGSSDSSLFLPPPPPPPLPNVSPAFVPPQLRSRPLAPPGPPGNRPPLPQRPPMPHNYGHPSMMMKGPAMRHPMQGPPMGAGPYGYQGHGHPMMRPPGSEATIEKPKVVYSAPPMRKFPKPDKKSESSVTESTTVVGESGPVMPVMEGMAERLHMEYEEAAMGMQGMELMEQEADMVQGSKKEKKEKKKKFIRTAAGTVWEDPTLSEWDQDDFRMFCGDLGNEVTDEHLARAFSKYPTFVKAKVVRDRRSNKTKGYGFVSFKDPNDFARAMREMNGKYVGNRPIKLRKSSWKDRQIDVVRKKDKEKKRLGLR